MITTTQGIVLRSIKYGETSLVCTVFTRLYGVQTYLVQHGADPALVHIGYRGERSPIASNTSTPAAIIQVRTLTPHSEESSSGKFIVCALPS